MEPVTCIFMAWRFQVYEESMSHIYEVKMYSGTFFESQEEVEAAVCARKKRGPAGKAGMFPVCQE